MAAGNIITGNTMPVSIPKAASGSATPSRLGTMRFSAVDRPLFRSSARAKGTAVSRSRLVTGIRGPFGAFSRSRRIQSNVSVRAAPTPLPKITHWQARTGSDPA